MVNRYVVSNNFSLGQIKRTLKSTPLADQALEQATNFRASSVGGMQFRNGFRQLTYSIGDAFLIPYGRYVLEIGVGKMRIWLNREPLTTGDEIEIEYTDGNTIYFPDPHGFTAGDQLILTEVERNDDVVSLYIYEVIDADSPAFVIVNGLVPEADFCKKVLTFANTYDQAQINALHYTTLHTGVYICVSRKGGATPARVAFAGYSNGTWSFDQTANFSDEKFTNPQTCFMHETRLGFFEENKMYMSVVGEPTNFAESTDTKAAFNFSLINRDVDSPFWAESTTRVLMVGCGSAILEMYGGSAGEAMSTGNIIVREASGDGASTTQGIRCGNKVVFEKSTRKGALSALFDGFSEIIRVTDSGAVSDLTHTPAYHIAYFHDDTDRVVVVAEDGTMFEGIYSMDEANRIPSWSEVKHEGMKFRSVAPSPKPGESDGVMAVIEDEKEFFLTVQEPHPNYESVSSVWKFENDQWVEDDVAIERYKLSVQNELFLDRGLVYDGFTKATAVIVYIDSTLITVDENYFTSYDIGKDIYIRGWRYTIQQVISPFSVEVAVRSSIDTEPVPGLDWALSTDTVTGLEPDTEYYVKGNNKLIGYMTSDAEGKIVLEDQFIYIQLGKPYVGVVRTMPRDIIGSQSEGASVASGDAQLRVLNSASFKAGLSLNALSSFNDKDSVNARALQSGEFVSVGLRGVSSQTDQIYIVQDKPQSAHIVSIGTFSKYSEV